MYCTKCGKEISQQQAFCPYCGHVPSQIGDTQQPTGRSGNKGCGVGLAVVIVLTIGAIGSTISNVSKYAEISNAEDATQNTMVNTTNSCFAGECGIEASAHMKSNDFINHPELSINVRNVSGKDIAAIQFLAVPYDVYGEEIHSFATQERLHTDDLIRAGGHENMRFGPFLLSNIKSVKLYVYSVYYTDGSSWGDKDATRSQILRHAKRIEATFEQ